MKNNFYMNQPTTIINNTQSKIVFSLSLFTLIYVAIFKNIDPYKYIVVGALFEILWLFVVVAVLAIPAFALWAIFKNNFSFKSLYLYTLLISASTLYLLFLT